MVMDAKVEKFLELYRRNKELRLDYFNYRKANGKRYEKINYKEAYRLRKWVAAENKLNEFKNTLDEATLKEAELFMENE